MKKIIIFTVSYCYSFTETELIIVKSCSDFIVFIHVNGRVETSQTLKGACLFVNCNSTRKVPVKQIVQS